MTNAQRPFDCVIFDMDGTLVLSGLDFAAIRAELGVEPGCGILETIAKRPPEQRRQAEVKLHARELSNAAKATLMPHAVEVLDTCRAMGLKTALLTRNNRQALDIVMERFEDLRFDLVRCREDGVIKPQPDGVLLACGILGVDAARTICIGDFHYDIQAANSAGATSVLLTTNPDCNAFADEADYVIDELDELLEILK